MLLSRHQVVNKIRSCFLKITQNKMPGFQNDSCTKVAKIV